MLLLLVAGWTDFLMQLIGTVPLQLMLSNQMTNTHCSLTKKDVVRETNNALTKYLPLDDR